MTTTDNADNTLSYQISSVQGEQNGGDEEDFFW
jgi:hypothetical protein